MNKYFWWSRMPNDADQYYYPSLIVYNDGLITREFNLYSVIELLDEGYIEISWITARAMGFEFY